MAEIFNEQRVIGVHIVPDGTVLHNGQRVVGIREAGSGVLFTGGRRVLGVSVLSGSEVIYNEQVVIGAVIIRDGRTLYNGMPVVTVSGSGAAPVDPDRYMFFATRNRMPSGALVTAAAGTNYVCSKIVVSSPSYRTNTFRFHFSGFASTEGGNSPQETIYAGNATVIDGLLIRVGGAFHACSFAGAAGVTIADQSQGAWSDPLTLADAVAAETDIEIWLFYHTDAGQMQLPVYRIQKHRGERIWGAADYASLLAFKDTPDADSTPALETNYGGQTQPQYYGPDFMVAKGEWDGRPVALVACDSIGEARQEFSAAADQRGNLGWLRKWLDSAWRIPHLMIGMPGAAAFRELTGSGASIATRRWAIVDEIIAFNGGKRPFTVILNQMGQNDTTTPYSTFFTTRYLGFVNRLRARYSGVKIVALPPLGRTSATIAITLTSVGTLATATCASTAHLISGQSLIIAGATPSAYNGTYVISVTGPTTFTYTFAGGTSPATGTITAADDFRTEASQTYAAQNTYPADGTDASNKWRLRSDILAKTSACCDDGIDTLAAWQGPAGMGKWPGQVDLPSSVLTVQAGTDGVATYTSIQVADGSIFSPEQPLRIYSADGLTLLRSPTIAAVNGNVLTLAAAATVLPAGSLVRQAVSPDGVHPHPAMVKRIRLGVAQGEKEKLKVA
ncbi:hypothetical protein [Rhizobium vallis]